jgi:hypothetical protein
MPKRKLVDRPVEKKINMPTSLMARVELEVLFSETEGRVPHGKWSEYVCGLIRQDLAQRTRPEAGQ